MFKRKDGLWQEQITVTVQGKKKSKYFYGKSKAAVKLKIVEYQGEAEMGRLFSAVSNEFWEQHEPTLTHNTKCGYIPALRRANEEFGDKRIKTITAMDINNYIVRLAMSGYAQKTVKNHLLIINLIFKFAVINGCIDVNPAMAVSVPKNLPKRKRSLPTDKDIDIIKNNLDKDFGLFAYFILYSGCRKGEALAIQGANIQRDKKIIKITKSVYFDSNTPKVKCPKTEAGTREIILIDKLADVLPNIGPNDYLFNHNGSLYTRSQFQDGWERYCKNVGISCTPHQLRHAYATILFEAGISPKDAQELLGHANISTTQDIYTHIRQSRKAQLYDILNAI